MPNPQTPTQRLDPFPYYAEMRRTEPVAQLEALRGWGVFGHDDVRTVLATPALFSSDLKRMLPGKNREKSSIVFSDPPRHTKLRALVNKAFTPQAVARLEPRIRAIADAFLDAVAPRGEMDLVNDFSSPLPVTVIAELVGVAPEDRARFKAWADIQMTVLNAAVGSAVSASYDDAERELFAYFRDVIAQRRAEPREDMVSALVAAEVDGEHLDEGDLLNFCRVLLVAGLETTTNLVGNAVLSLLEHPAELARLRADPALVPSAIEEALRYRSPTQALMRIVRADTELGGKLLREGERVVAYIGSANRDERKFEAPERFDAGRDPNAHLAFGAGIHFCLGASLARLEGRIALEALLARLSDLRRADDSPLEPVQGAVHYGVRRLPVVFRST